MYEEGKKYEEERKKNEYQKEVDIEKEKMKTIYDKANPVYDYY